ncbi:MAG: hypothetical protein IPQ00_17300 [Chloracidobacterium sp.]|nr:hypothetical protein [Chloracidobacterium sp.]
MNEDFYEMLDAIGKRPAMYIDPSQSITALYNYLGGYRSSAGWKKIMRNTEPSYAEFNNWVAMKLNFYESTKGWRRMLLERENDDEEKAFERFFGLLREFRNRKETRLFRAELPKKSGRKTKRLEIVKYTDDGGVFVRSIDSKDKIIDEMYWQTLANALEILEIQLGKLSWEEIKN